MTDVYGTAGDDDLYATKGGLYGVAYGYAGNDTLHGIAGVDAQSTLIGGSGNDTYIVSSTYGFPSVLPIIIENKNRGIDTLIATAYGALVNVLLPDNVENLVYAGQNSVVGRGNALSNVITGNIGSDWLVGYAGNDTLIGGAGNDTLDGGEGRDRLVGGTGNDRYVVDNVRDTVVEEADGGTDLVYTALSSYTLGANVENLTFTGGGTHRGIGNELDNEISGSWGSDTLDGAAGNDRLFGYDGNDTLYGRDGDDWLNGGGDNDTLLGGTGNDTLWGWTGNDRLYGEAGDDRLFGEDGSDFLNGGDGNDTLSGGSGNDTLLGGRGFDTLQGGYGADLLTGGNHADTFVYTSVSDSLRRTSDTITDFTAAQGDKLDLSAIDANISTRSDDAFVFIGSSAFSGVAGELRFKNGLLQGDVNGDKVADISIKLDNVDTLSVQSIML